jgi:demethylmacrocin O-methyltransferase
MTNWDEVAIKWGTDKASTHHGYMSIYEDILSNRQIDTLLEIGVAHGKSLFMWNELLPDTLIVGLDILPECRLHQRINIACLIADAKDPAKMAAVTMLHGPFQVIIDDGEHDPDQIRIAFEELYPRLPSGAVYIIEDVDETAKWVVPFLKQWDGNLIKGIDKCLIVIKRL